MAHSVPSVPSRGKNQMFRHVYVCVSICKVNHHRLAAEHTGTLKTQFSKWRNARRNSLSAPRRPSSRLFVRPPRALRLCFPLQVISPPRLRLSLINLCLICYLFSLITVVTLSRRSAAWLSHLIANSLFMFFHHGTIFLWQTSEEQLQGGLMGQSSVGMRERRQVSSLLLPFLSS